MQPSFLRVSPRLVCVLSVLGPIAIAGLPAQSMHWTRLQTAQAPPALGSFAAATDTAHQRVVLFGNGGSDSAATWLWDGASWLQPSVTVQPPARSGHAMAYDPSRQRVVLFGGQTPDETYLADTWEWNGTAWVQILYPPSSPVPGARSFHAMAFDPVTSSVLLFGGQPLGTDTWRWNGVQWTQEPSPTSPVARWSHAMATDPVRQRIVLFGGFRETFGGLADTWEWNGSSWLPVFSVVGAPNPPARGSHALAFDPDRGEVVLFGGADQTVFGDTWTFDGDQWVDRTLATSSPPPMIGHVLTADARQYGLVLFGGGDGGNGMGETWRNLDGRALPYGTGCGAPPVRLRSDDAAPPVLGQTGRATITDAPTSVAVVVAGFSDVYYGPFPLPVTLAGIGMPGCELLQSADIFGLGTTPLGPTSASFAIAIPDQASLLGQHVYLQAVAFAPGSNAAQLVVSNGLDWTFDDAQVELQIDETFATTAGQDLDGSSSLWNGGARPGPIGGDGRHGSFDVTLGTPLGGGVYEWNTDNFTIPASHSLNGQPYQVTDGRFYFTDFVLPAGTTLRFTGSAPARIWVRGSAVVDGSIDVSAPDLPFWVPTTGPAAGQHVSSFNGIGPSTSYSAATPNFAAGQPGGAGGPGGGRGGDGADECQLDGDVVATIGLGLVHRYYGRAGEGVQVAAGHAYASAATVTGGKGALLQPLDGTAAAASTPLIGFLYRGNFSPGGGGGGFSTVGTAASITTQPAGVAFAATQPGGAAMMSLSPPVTLGDSIRHYLVGGAGGGGGGSHAYGTLNVATTGSYVAGGAGSGGGGALMLRAGGDLTVTSTAQLHARGGDGVLITGDDPNTPGFDANWGVTSPGGGGSGGSLLLQAGRDLAFAGLVDVRGGRGSRTGSISIAAGGAPAAFDIVSEAGSGGRGYYRLEAWAALPTFTGTVAAGTSPYNGDFLFGNGSLLDDVDAVTGSRSAWRSAGTTVAPTWVRYELDVDLDGNGTVDVTYTDSGAPGTQAADDPAGGVRIQFQGAQLDATGAPIAGTIGPWRDGVGSAVTPGIDLDGATGFRFQLWFDTSVGPSLVVRALRVVARVSAP